jgi:hypothetical protein
MARGLSSAVLLSVLITQSSNIAVIMQDKKKRGQTIVPREELGDFCIRVSRCRQHTYRIMSTFYFTYKHYLLMLFTKLGTALSFLLMLFASSHCLLALPSHLWISAARAEPDVGGHGSNLCRSLLLRQGKMVLKEMFTKKIPMF